MDEARIKAMAHKIEMHAEAIKLRMQALQYDSLEDAPTNVVGVNFQDVIYYCEAMQRIVNEILPSLLPAPSTEPEKCEVCEKTDGPFIRVEVSEDGERHQWLAVCSDDCLQQVTREWKQVSEIIRP